MASSSGSKQGLRGKSRSLPSKMLQNEFGKVYLREENGRRHVEFTIWLRHLPETIAEGWKTGVALDGSESMKDWYGRSVRPVDIPPEMMEEYKSKGWVASKVKDGREVRVLKRVAYEDATKRGVIKFTDNIVEPLAREFTAYLSAELSAEGGVSLIYWACGKDGAGFEEVGDLTEEQCQALELTGPSKFGGGTKLAPAVKYFIEKFKDARQAMCVFITDGQLQDLDEVKQLTTTLAREIAAGRRNLLKCVLIGVGNEVNAGQMEELDDLETGVDVDIWDHKLAAEMRSLSEIMVELVAENRGISAPVTIFDAAGNEAARFTDGMPATVRFSMPHDSNYFELEIGDRRIRQDVVVPGVS